MSYSPDTIEPLAETFHLLGEPGRLRLVVACLEGPVSVQDLAVRAGLSPSLTSHHLRLLKASRMVRAERDGRHVRYTVADEHVSSLIRNMLAHLAEDADEGGEQAGPR